MLMICADFFPKREKPIYITKALKFIGEMYHDQTGQWYRAYGNENWEFDERGFMKKRYASINDLPIDQADRRL